MDRGFICLAGRIDWGTGELLPDRQFPLKRAMQSTCSKRPSLTMVLLGGSTLIKKVSLPHRSVSRLSGRKALSSAWMDVISQVELLIEQIPFFH